MKPLELRTRGKDRGLPERVAELLAAYWDPDAEFNAPAVYVNESGATVSGEGRVAAAHAEVILAMYAAGAPQADVVGYLRRAEEDSLGRARTTPGQRWALAALIWRWSNGSEPLPKSGRDVNPFALGPDQGRDAAP